MKNESEYRPDEPAKAYGVLIGCAVATFFAVWGIDTFVQWWFKNMDTLHKLVYALLFLVLIVLGLVLIVAISLIPHQSVKLSDKFSKSSGKRFIIFGTLGLALFISLTIIYGKEAEVWVGILYFAIVFIDGILIARKGKSKNGK